MSDAYSGRGRKFDQGRDYADERSLANMQQPSRPGRCELFAKRDAALAIDGSPNVTLLH
jgi:hypothetical protein